MKESLPGRASSVSSGGVNESRWTLCLSADINLLFASVSHFSTQPETDPPDAAGWESLIRTISLAPREPHRSRCCPVIKSDA